MVPDFVHRMNKNLILRARPEALGPGKLEKKGFRLGSLEG